MSVDDNPPPVPGQNPPPQPAAEIAETPIAPAPTPPEPGVTEDSEETEENS